MAYVDVARFIAVSSGTVDFVVSAAATGYQTPSAAGALDAATFYYRAESADLTQWEVGIGTWALGSVTLARTTVLFNSSGTTSKISFSIAPQVAIVALAEGLREKLLANRTIFVRTFPVNISFAAASASINWHAHGLSVNDPVVVDILPFPNTGITITNANPGVVTWTTHGFSAGQPITFSTSGYLPPGITPGTTYYVIATGLSTNTFQFSATPGGSAVNTSKLTLTAASGTGAALQITSSAAHGLVAGQEVAFANSGGGLPGGLAASTIYYVAASPAPTATVFYASTINGGTNVAFSSAGTGTNTLEQVGGTTTTNFGSSATHRGTQAGAMPTFSGLGPGLLVAGTVYFVGTVVDADHITLSTTLANANPIGTATLATGSPVYYGTTGNDNNSGMAQTRTGALLTIQKAVDIACALDLGIFSVTIQLAASLYTAEVLPKSYVGAGPITILGDTTFPSNARIQTTGLVNPHAAIFLNAIGTASLYSIRGVAISTITSGHCIHALGSSVQWDTVEFGVCGGGYNHLYIEGGSVARAAGSYTITGGSPGGGSHLTIRGASYIDTTTATVVTMLGVPAFAGEYVYGDTCAAMQAYSMTFIGSATGLRYNLILNAAVYVAGAGANYFPGNSAGSTATGAQYA